MEIWSALVEAFHAWRPWAGGVICVVGTALALIGTVGVLRFPDFYTRMHAASVTDTSGATLLLVGMGLMSPDLLTVFKLAAIWVFLFLTGPTASHAIANAAHVAGVQPVTGARGRPGQEEG
jgi:multicomponent Na+:H+ antiporter subunit G